MTERELFLASQQIRDLVFHHFSSIEATDRVISTLTKMVDIGNPDDIRYQKTLEKMDCGFASEVAAAAGLTMNAPPRNHHYNK